MSVQQIDAQRPALTEYLPELNAEMCNDTAAVHHMVWQRRSGLSKPDDHLSLRSSGQELPMHHRLASANTAVDVQCAPVKMQVLQHIAVIRVVISDRSVEHDQRLPSTGTVALPQTPAELHDDQPADHVAVTADPAAFTSLLNPHRRTTVADQPSSDDGGESSSMDHAVRSTGSVDLDTGTAAAVRTGLSLHRPSSSSSADSPPSPSHGSIRALQWSTRRNSGGGNSAAAAGQEHKVVSIDDGKHFAA